MYAVHCVLAGLVSFFQCWMHILNVGVGMTFSGGLIDLVLFGVMQGNAKTHWMWGGRGRCGVLVLYLHHFPLCDLQIQLQDPGPRRCRGSQVVHSCGRERLQRRFRQHRFRQHRPRRG